MRTKYRIIRNYQELDLLIELCIKLGIACVDFETNGNPIHNKDFKPTILSVSCIPGLGVSIPLDHPETKDYTDRGWEWKRALRRFAKRIIENRQVVKIAWNAKFDFAIFQLFGYFYRGTLLDGMLAKYLLNEEKPNDLKSMVSRYIPEAAGYEADRGFDKLPWDKKPLEQLCQYGCQDTDYSLRLMIFFEQKLLDNNLYDLYRNLIMPASRVLQTVEFNGLYLDRAFNKKLLDEYRPKIDKARSTCLELPVVKKFQTRYNQQKIDRYIESIEKELEDLDYNDPKDARKIASREQKIANIRAGIFSTKKEKDLNRDINLGSPVDLPALMFSKDGFNMKPIKETNTGKPSTDEESLVEIRLKIKNPKSPKAVFLDSLLELRGLEKMYKTYILGWSEKVQDDDCLHGRFQIQGTTSGRLSCVSGDTKIQTQLGLIPIKEIPSVNHLLLTPTQEGLQPITDFIYKGVDDMYEVELEDGTLIQCTLDHKFITNLGTASLREIYNKDRGTIVNKYKLLKYVES